MQRHSPAVAIDIKKPEQPPSKRGSVTLSQGEGKGHLRAAHKGLLSDTYSQAPTTSDSNKALPKGISERDN